MASLVRLASKEEAYAADVREPEGATRAHGQLGHCRLGVENVTDDAELGLILELRAAAARRSPGGREQEPR